MVTIRSFDDCLTYVSHLGVIPQIKSTGWIPNYQSSLCELCDKLRNASGNYTWYHLEFKPFTVEFNRKGRYFVVQRKIEQGNRSTIISAVVPVH